VGCDAERNETVTAGTRDGKQELMDHWKTNIIFIYIISNVIYGHIPFREKHSVFFLKYCAISRKVAGSIPEGVIGIFH